MAHGIFITALNCMDGRCQEKALAYTKNLFENEANVDMITEPGIDGLLAGTHSVVGPEEIPARIEWIRAKAEISAKGHGSTQVMIFGHCGCAGNKVELDGHKEHLRLAKKTVEGWGLFKEVQIAVFNEAFEVEPVS
ncbi:hypothetical protein H0X32_02810 [Patescibacteria group bacterium]|nr:hypothetical protein [Patescibacteria group bacterium]